MKHLLALIFLIQLAGSSATQKIIQTYNFEDYIRKNAHHHVKRLSPERFDKIVKRYNEVILENSDKYGIPSWLIVRVIRTESGFRWWAKSHKSAYGPMQVIPHIWSQELYKIDPKLSKELLASEDPEKLYKKYLCQIGIGTEVGTRVLRYYIRRFGSVDLGLLAYNRGGNSKKVKAALKNPGIAEQDKYVKDVMTK